MPPRARLYITLGLSVTLFVGYILSIFLRVSLSEQEQFGRSCLLPLKSNPPKFTEPANDSFGDATFTFVRGDKPIIVYKQLINSFQHAYASALVSLELGDAFSDFLFRSNEYVESLFCKSSGTDYFYQDTKKDLANNAIGRLAGRQARARGLTGRIAEKYIVERILDGSDHNKLISHWKDPRVQMLPTPEQFGCPGLTKIQEMRRADPTLVFH